MLDAREVDPAWAHLDAAYLVGTEATGSVPSGDLRGIMAGPGGRTLPTGVSGQGGRADRRFCRKADGDMNLLETSCEESKNRWAALAKLKARLGCQKEG